ncbi:hypothetical protein WN944_029465 [Citrus x changshan-huyou]|uniref:Uncharacterized protein n=1 Tax=Citrus x changshan-huyou TaxID=2935761 RepID=A0AAP0LLB3_9ROSI
MDALDFLERSKKSGFELEAPTCSVVVAVYCWAMSSKSYLGHLIVHLGISITEDEALRGCGGALGVTQVRVDAASVTVTAHLQLES